jgi:hypothetical protein
MSLETQGIILSVTGPALLFLWAGVRGYRGCRTWKTVILSWVLLVAYSFCLALAFTEISRADSMENALLRRKETSESLARYLPDGTHVLVQIFFGWFPGFAASTIGAGIKKRGQPSTPQV